MNRAALVARALTRSGVGYDAALAANVVNEALASLSTEERWPWLQGAAWTFTAAGPGPFTPPPGWRDITSVTVSDTLYQHVHVEDIDREPGWVGWCVRNEQLVIAPDLDANEEVLVRIDRDEGSLDGDSDEPLLPEKWQHAVVNLAAAILCERVDDAKRGAQMRADYHDTLRRMRRDLRRGRGALAVRVRPGAGI